MKELLKRFKRYICAWPVSTRWTLEWNLERFFAKVRTKRAQWLNNNPSNTWKMLHFSVTIYFIANYGICDRSRKSPREIYNLEQSSKLTRRFHAWRSWTVKKTRQSTQTTNQPYHPLENWFPSMRLFSSHCTVDSLTFSKREQSLWLVKRFTFVGFSSLRFKSTLCSFDFARKSCILIMSFNKRAFQRLFILLDKKLQAVPGKLENTRLENAGRVKEISFTKNCSASRIGRLLESSFSSLAGQDLSR